MDIHHYTQTQALRLAFQQLIATKQLTTWVRQLAEREQRHYDGQVNRQYARGSTDRYDLHNRSIRDVQIQLIERIEQQLAQLKRVYQQ